MHPFWGIKMINTKNKKMDLLDSSGPIHVKVRSHLQKTIAQMEQGEKLPPERFLSEQFEVNRATIRRAMLDLEKEGFIVRHQGRGTFVKKAIHLGTSSSKSNKVIGMSITNFDLPNSQGILKGVDEEASQNGYGVLVCNCEFSPGRERENLDRLKTQNLDGLIVVPFAEDSLNPEYLALIEDIHRQGKKVVLVDVYIPTLKIPVVMSNRVMVGYMATQHLIMLGHRRICYATTGRYDTSGRDCLRGYRTALADYGIEYNEKLVVENPLHLCAEPTKNAIINLLKENPRACTAIATDVFSMTYGILNALTELGRRVPEDIALVGADVAQNPELSYVTHTAQPFRQMGQEAVKLLLHPKDESMKKHVLLTPDLVVGKTCGFSTRAASVSPEFHPRSEHE
jgi:DNA-binding LacI/PurR family transcriptional regulator